MDQELDFQANSPDERELNKPILKKSLAHLCQLAGFSLDVFSDILGYPYQLLLSNVESHSEQTIPLPSKTLLLTTEEVAAFWQVQPSSLLIEEKPSPNSQESLGAHIQARHRTACQAVGIYRRMNRIEASQLAQIIEVDGESYFLMEKGAVVFTLSQLKQLSAQMGMTLLELWDAADEILASK